jgi:hypothetical protein
MGDRFGPGAVVNRRVNRHLQELVPEASNPDVDYTFEGRRGLPADQVLGRSNTGVCTLEAFVGVDGQFEIRVERVFDPDSERQWVVRNRIARTETTMSRSVGPFEYVVRTELVIQGDERTDESVVDWTELGEDPIYGGREGRAATILAERMANRRAGASPGADHYGSLSGVGSLSAVVDNDRYISTDWETLDGLVGPEADTIAATADTGTIASNEERERAKAKGIDFLADGLHDDLEDRGGETEGWRTGNLWTDIQDRPDDEGWRSLPDGMTEAEAREKIRGIVEEIRNMKRDT